MENDVLLAFLHVPTPKKWVDASIHFIPELLIDHANCEKKAASAAITLMNRYIQHPNLTAKMSRLAREELRHFEQVLSLMGRLDVAYLPLSASRYGKGLHALIREGEPQVLVDKLIIGAYIEARSCERFLALLPVLPEPIARLYQRLVKSELRHFEDYLALAKDISQEDISDRVALIGEKESELITSEDNQFRFHSGLPSNQLMESIAGQSHSHLIPSSDQEFSTMSQEHVV